MRCSSCTTENPAGAAACAGCGKKLPRRGRRRGGESSAPLLAHALPNNPSAVAAYRYALYGLIPLVGLVLGGLALGHGIFGFFHARTHPDAKGVGHAVTGIVLGGLEFLTNGAGLVLIAAGLRSLAG